VDWSIFGINLHAGQVCHAGSRIYVHENVYDSFLAAFTKKMKTVKVGTNFSGETDQGPQINKMQHDKILGYIDIGKKEGAKLHLGGNAVSGEGGYFIEPTIFTDVTPDMKVRGHFNLRSGNDDLQNADRDTRLYRLRRKRSSAPWW
jgi:aldehyde dehydrogenase (NAD+)